MRLWPWRTEKREADASTGEAALTAALLQARNALGPATGGIAALEACAGAWSRAFASAQVSPDTATTRLLTASTMAQIGRGLITQGETLHWFESNPTYTQLAQAKTWDVHGNSINPLAWSYDVYAQAPTGTTRRRLSGDSVLHCKFACEAGIPYRGKSPLQFANLSADVAGKIEQSLRGEFSAPTALIWFSGAGVHYLDDLESDGHDPRKPKRDPLMDQLSAMQRGQGNFFVADALRNGPDVGEGEGDPYGIVNTPPVSERVGPSPPQEVDEVRSTVMDSIYSACGVSPALFKAASAGAARESWRQFLHGSVAPVAAVVAEELSTKLGVRVRLSFERLFASDLSGRARAFQSLTGGGLEVAVARELAGLEAA